MDFNKNEAHILKYLFFYKILSVACVVVAVFNIFYGLYLYFFRMESSCEIHLNNALIGAAIVVSGIGYLMYCFLKIIEKFKNNFLNKN